ncbi:MAG: hypothetical protein AB8H79_23370 [Myxococcota bacterium]
MANAISYALKTARQILATSGVIVCAFGLPALMAGGVGVHQMAQPDLGELVGNSSDNRTVFIGVMDDKASGTADEDQVAEDAKGEELAKGKDDKTVDAAADAAPVIAPKKALVGQASSTKSKVERKTARAGRNTDDQAQKRAYMAARAKRAKARGKRCVEPVDGIEKVYGERYTIERPVINKYTGSVSEAMGLVSGVRWHKDKRGKTDGFRLYGVRCGSPLAQVGIRSGDVIHTINGRKVKSIPQAFVAVRKLRRHDAIRVEGPRGGTRFTKVVTVI